MNDVLDPLDSRTNSNGTTAHGFPWINEYIFRFDFDQNRKISAVHEFTDSTVVTQALTKEAIVAEAKFPCPNLQAGAP